MLTFRSNSTVAIGEAMIEMAVDGENSYRRNFAGDTFNTAWHISRLLGPTYPVGFVTRVGEDSVSGAFIDEIEGDGLDVSCIRREATRTMGLYMIELDAAERHFHYWRSESAARLLADDQVWLRQVLEDAGLIHLSGITLAILSSAAREALWEALSEAKSNGARVSFDPNIRPKLWSSIDETRTTLSKFFELTDIALPSYDDEAQLWGDASPDTTLERFKDAGVQEVAIKNGAGAVLASCDGARISVATPAQKNICDTSGAGDAFNAGYLAARLLGKNQLDAVASGQRISSEVIHHFGARVPKQFIPRLRTNLQ